MKAPLVFLLESGRTRRGSQNLSSQSIDKVGGQNLSHKKYIIIFLKHILIWYLYRAKSNLHLCCRGIFFSEWTLLTFLSSLIYFRFFKLFVSHNNFRISYKFQTRFPLKLFSLIPKHMLIKDFKVWNIINKYCIK